MHTLPVRTFPVGSNVTAYIRDGWHVGTLQDDLFDLPRLAIEALDELGLLDDVMMLRVPVTFVVRDDAVLLTQSVL